MRVPGTGRRPESRCGLYGLVDSLYREHAASLTAALALSLDDRSAAEDLSHEVFILTMSRERELSAHPDPRGWLFQTGYNLARNSIRLHFRRRHKVRQQMPILPPQAWDDVIDLRDSLSRLSRRERDVLILHDYLGFTASEVGGMLGCAEGSVRSHLHRARVALDRTLTQEAAQ